MSDFTIENVERDVSRHEITFQVKIAEAYKDQPLRIVNFYLDNGSDGTNPFATNIENYHLTDEQRLGLDPILHAGPDGGLRLCVETGFRRCAPTSLAR